MSININREIKSWFFIQKGKTFLEWRNAYRKCLKSIMLLRFDNKRLHKDSDKQYVEIMKQLIHQSQLWIKEMKNPIPLKN
jgi:hypothetical protein